MSSIAYTFGERILTNLFCRATVYRLIGDDQFDALSEPIDRRGRHTPGGAAAFAQWRGYLKPWIRKW